MITYDQALKHITDSFGYANMIVMADGGLLCLPCFKKEQDLIRSCEADLISQIGAERFEEETYQSSEQWIINYIDTNWADDRLICDHCYLSIDPVYED